MVAVARPMGASEGFRSDGLQNFLYRKLYQFVTKLCVHLKKVPIESVRYEIINYCGESQSLEEHSP